LTRALTGSFWPTPQQTLLLRVALLGGDAGVEAWRRVRPSIDLDTLESEALVLLPLLHSQLVAAGVDDPLLPRLRGIHHRTWYVNQLRLDRAAPVVAAIQAAGAEPLVVNSFELVLAYYRDLGARSVTALNLLVRPERFDAALRALGDPVRRGRDWASFAGAEGDEYVVRCRLVDEFARDVPADLWDAAVTVELGSVTAAALSPTDELLAVCLTGARARPWRSLVWIADAATILRVSGGAIDWPRLVEHATRLRATLRLHDALAFLRAELDVPVPDGVVGELGRVPVTRRDVLAHRLGSRAGAESLTRFLTATAEVGALRAVSRLPAFLRDDWRLERRTQVPLAALRRARRSR
jgi:Uncharacterised nucleotidyltransferase